MASCDSIIALAKNCASEGKMAGIQSLYIIRYADLVETNGSTYTLSTGGLISDINVATGKQFVPVGLLKNTVNIQGQMTKNLQTGTQYFTNTLTLVLSDITSENKVFLESVLNQEVAIVARLRTGKYVAVGLDANFELSAADINTGSKEDDLIGANLTFSGTSVNPLQLVDPSLIPAITAPAS